MIVWPDTDAVSAARTRYEQSLPPLQWFQQRLALHGFNVPVTCTLDAITRASLIAFQMKYRPARYDGSPDAETAVLLEICTQPGGWRLMGSDGRWRPDMAP